MQGTPLLCGSVWPHLGQRHTIDPPRPRPQGDPLARPLRREASSPWPPPPRMDIRHLLTYNQRRPRRRPHPRRAELGERIGSTPGLSQRGQVSGRPEATTSKGTCHSWPSRRQRKGCLGKAKLPPSMRIAFPLIRASAIFRRADLRMRWKVGREICIRSAHSTCCRPAKSLRRRASTSSTVKPTSSSALRGMPAGLKYVTSGMDATCRHFLGLAMTVGSYEPMSIIIMPHVEPVVNDLAPEKKSRRNVSDEGGADDSSSAPDQQPWGFSLVGDPATVIPQSRTDKC